jgi:hypothetical protein
MRLLNGEGPEITVPPWANQPAPTPEQWLHWFDQQSREAQLVIAEYHIHIEGALAAIEELHQLHRIDDMGMGVCTTCGMREPWPCPTRRALEPDDE